jgi:hypothetical protein
MPVLLFSKDCRVGNWLRGLFAATMGSTVSYLYGGNLHRTTAVVVPLCAGTRLIPFSSEELSDVFSGARFVGLPLLSATSMAWFWDLVSHGGDLALDAATQYAFQAAKANLGGYPRGVELFVLALVGDQRCSTFEGLVRCVRTRLQVDRDVVNSAYRRTEAKLLELYDKHGAAMRRPQLLAVTFCRSPVPREGVLDGIGVSDCTAGLPIAVPPVPRSHQRVYVEAPAIVQSLLINSCCEALDSSVLRLGTCLRRPGTLLADCPAQASQFEHLVAAQTAALLCCTAWLPGVAPTMGDLIPSALFLNEANTFRWRSCVDRDHDIGVGELSHRFPDSVESPDLLPPELTSGRKVGAHTLALPPLCPVFEGFNLPKRCFSPCSGAACARSSSMPLARRSRT